MDKQKRKSNPKKSMIRRSKSISNNPTLFHQQQPPLLPLPTQPHPHHQQQPQHYPCTTARARNNMMSLITPPNKPPHYYSSFSSSQHFLTPKPHHHLPAVSTPYSFMTSTTSNNKVTGFDAMFSSISSACSYNNVWSPPPSSLPLPKFCMRSKLSCKAKTSVDVGVGLGRTQDLPQVLHLK